MIEKNIKDLEIKFIGVDNWRTFRDFMIVKLGECDTEDKLSKFMEVLLGSMFKDADELDNARKKMGKELLAKHERNEINKYLEQKK